MFICCLCACLCACLCVCLCLKCMIEVVSLLLCVVLFVFEVFD